MLYNIGGNSTLTPCFVAGKVGKTLTKLYTQRYHVLKHARLDIVEAVVARRIVYLNELSHSHGSAS